MNGNVLTAAAAQLWRDRQVYQTPFYVLGVVLMLSGMFHGVVLVASGGPLTGALSWRKPATFGLSFGLTLVTLTWIFDFLPKSKIGGWLLLTPLGLAMTGEVLLVSMQRWRGVRSHFNYATAFDAAVFGAMGQLVSIIGLVIVALAIWSMFPMRRAPSTSMAWAIRIGLLALAGAQGFGGAIIANGVAQVFDPQTGQFVVAATETAARYGAAGSLKLTHALPMHVIQVLAILAWVLSFTQLNVNRQLRLVLLAAAGCAGLIAVSAAQTFSGAAPFALRPLLAAATVAAGLAILLPYATAAVRLSAPPAVGTSE